MECLEANQTFKFSDGNNIALLGEPDEDGSFSEFTLINCKSDSSIDNFFNDTGFPFIIKFKDDTLFVDETYCIPNGKNKEIEWLPFYQKKYFFNNEKLTCLKSVNKNLKKYDKKEIKEVLLEFKKVDDKESNFAPFLKSVNQLFWAYYSGSKEAELELEKLRSKYNDYDGAVSEEFRKYISTYEIYKNNVP